MVFSKEELLDMYREAAKARVFSEKIIEYILSGKIGGSIHPPLGQEGVSAGIIAATRKSGIKNYGTSTHRMQSVMAERSGLKPFVCELLCRNGGPNDGISGEYHLTDVENTAIPATGAIGGAWPLLAGFAWAIKNEGRKNEICLAPYGDGAISGGVTYEAMNMAAIFKLPMLFIIENNGVAMSTPVCKQSPLENLADRAAAFNMKGVTVDGNDIIATAEAVLEGMKMAANNEPNVVEIKCTRWAGHYVGDKDEAYRDVSFRDNLEEIDAVLILKEKLKSLGYLDDATADAMREEVTAEIEEAFDYGVAQPVPTQEQVLDSNRMYANPEGGMM